MNGSCLRKDNSMKSLSTPKTKIAKVLHALATGRVISAQEFGINSFRSILSDLRNDYGIPIRHAKQIGKDEFGKRSWYYKYFTLSIDRRKCERVYQQINQ